MQIFQCFNMNREDIYSLYVQTLSISIGTLIHMDSVCWVAGRYVLDLHIAATPGGYFPALAAGNCSGGWADLLRLCLEWRIDGWLDSKGTQRWLAYY